MRLKTLHQPLVLNFVVKTSIIAVFVIGLLSFAEFLSGKFFLDALISNYSPMKLVTISLTVLTSLSLWLFLKQGSWRKHFLRVTGGIVVFVSLLTFLTYLHGKAAQNDYMLFNFFLKGDNRMAFFTTIIFLFLGVIFILFTNNSRKQDDIAHVLFFPAATLSYFSTISYVLDVSDIFRVEGIIIAPATAISLFLLCLVILFLKPDTWLMRILSGPGLGSIMGRRLLPWLLVLPVVIAWVRIKGEQQHYFFSEVGVILVAITYTLTYLLLVWWSGLYINKIDQKRQQAHDALEESRARLNALITATSDGVYRMSADWKQMLSMEGRNYLTSVESPVDDWLNSFIPKASHLQVLETINRAIATKSKFELEHNIIRNDGTIGWALSRAIPVLDKNGEIVEWMGIAHDFTDRKNTELALQKSEKNLSGIYNSMTEGISVNQIIYDAEGKAVDYVLLDANPAFEKMTGQKISEVKGMRASERYSVQKAPYLDEWAQVVASGEPNHFETYFPPLKKHFSISGFPMENGKFATLFWDVTEIKLAEKALLESMEQFRLLFENSLDAILYFNADGTVLSMNPEAERMLGRNKEEMLHLTKEEFIDLNDPRYIAALEERQQTGRFKGELNFLKKDGIPFPVDVTWTIFKDSNGQEKSGFIIRDITERKRAEAEVIASKEKAEESDRLKSAFLANMSHELRTPLNSIIGFSELLADPDFDQMEGSKFAQIIHTSGNNLLSIINDIMDISKIEAGQVQIMNKLFSVNKLASELQAEYSFNATQKGIELTIDSLNPADEVFIESDQNKIRQILVNLVGNAIKFTEKGFVQLGWRIANNFIEFQVKDTGIGIPADFQTQIFERFRQVESSETRKYGGTGLGLAISKSLTELLGGTIWIASKQGEGSTFYFTVPIRQ